MHGHVTKQWRYVIARTDLECPVVAVILDDILEIASSVAEQPSNIQMVTWVDLVTQAEDTTIILYQSYV